MSNTTPQPLGEQHADAIANHPADCEAIAAALQGLFDRGLTLSDVVERAEAGAALFLQRQGVDTDPATGLDLSVTFLLSGEIATDLFPHLKLARAA